MKAYKSLEAYNQLQSGFVQEVRSFNTSQEVVILKAHVLHSQSLNKEPCKPWTAIKKDGTVISAHCDCMAGYVE